MQKIPYTDFLKMCNDILEFVKFHGGAILLNDDPIHREIGYCSDQELSEGDPLWVIDIKDLKRSIFESPLSQEDRDKLSQEVRGVQSRAKIGWALGKGFLPWTDWDRFDRIQGAYDA